LDMVALKYSIMINGVTDLIVTKSDVLSGLDTIKVATKYKYKGEIIDYMPYDMCDDIEPIYEELPGWKEDITKCTKLEELPKELLDYIKYLEEKTQVKIKYLSLGPDREQTIELSVKSL